jgi:hypothetical protein
MRAIAQHFDDGNTSTVAVDSFVGLYVLQYCLRRRCRFICTLGR